MIGDYCHVSTGAIVNGGVKIGASSFIGSGAVLREGIDLPPKTVISAGKRVMGGLSERSTPMNRTLVIAEADESQW